MLVPLLWWSAILGPYLLWMLLNYFHSVGEYSTLLRILNAIGCRFLLILIKSRLILIVIKSRRFWRNTSISFTIRIVINLYCLICSTLVVFLVIFVFATITYTSFKKNVGHLHHGGSLEAPEMNNVSGSKECLVK